MEPYRIEGGADILGDFVPVLVPSEGRFELTRLFVFADGICRVGADGKLIHLEEALSWYENARLTNHAPASSRISVTGLGEFSCVNDFGGVDDRERQKEIRDLEHTLRGNQSAVRHCMDVFRKYRASPTPTAKLALHAAYEAVPEHLRPYCGDMDSKDSEIRRTLDLE